MLRTLVDQLEPFEILSLQCILTSRGFNGKAQVGSVADQLEPSEFFSLQCDLTSRGVNGKADEIIVDGFSIGGDTLLLSRRFFLSNSEAVNRSARGLECFISKGVSSTMASADCASRVMLMCLLR